MTAAAQDPASFRTQIDQAFVQARSLQADGRLGEARQLYEQILLRFPHHAESLTLLASISYQAGDDTQGLAYHDRAIAVFQEILRHQPGAIGAEAPLANLLLARGRQAEAEAICRGLKFPLNPIRMTPQQMQDRRQQSLLAGLPPMIINTLPKSASESIWNRLAEGLGLPQAHISLGLFPDCCVVGPRAQALAEGGLIVKEHIPATPHNLILLKAAGLRRLVFHTRDPRQATLSWAHFVKDDVAMRLMAPIWRRIVPPAPLLARELPAVIDWCLERYLPEIVAFIEGWTRAAADSAAGLSVLFLDFESFRRAPDDYIGQVLDFHAIPREKYRAEAASGAEVVHLRKGEIEEWRGVFTPAQQERAWQAIPAALAERFGWER